MRARRALPILAWLGIGAVGNVKAHDFIPLGKENYFLNRINSYADIL